MSYEDIILEKEAVITKNEEVITKKEQEIEYLKYEVERLKHLIFGAKSEKFVPSDDSYQGNLLAEVETDQEEPVDEESSPGK